MKENNVKFELEPASFGPGYRKFTAVRKVDFCPICSSSEPDIVLEALPTEQFRFEKSGAEGNEYTRIRSDVSMLLHAADMAKKYGPGFVQSMIDMRRPKSSSIQSQMDQMSDAQILDTIKSRHLQSPSELIAWSEHLMEQAKDLEQEAERLSLEKQVESVVDPSSSSPEPSPSQSE
nr:MAG: internal scaffolding protein [Microvirus sp.]